MMIHIDRGGERMGPYSLEDVNRYLADGTLRPSDLGWYDGAAGWVPVTNIEGVVAAGGAVPPPTPGAAGSTCPNCQAPVETTQIVCMGCGTRLKEAPAAGGGTSSKTALIAVGSVVLIAGIVLGVMQPWKKAEGDNADTKNKKGDISDSASNDEDNAVKPAPQDLDIFEALKPGNEEALKQLIASGADLNVKGPIGTPLAVTAIYGYAASAMLLINGGADVNAPGNDGSTALHAAAFFCRPEIVKALLAKGANVNAQNLKGETPLSSFALPWPAAQGIYQLVGGLLQVPMDQKELERIQKNRPQIAQMLGGAGGASIPGGNPPRASLQDAIFHEDLAAVKKFIAGGADVNAPEPDDGSTPLHTAAFVCNIEIVKVLIAAKANVNAKNKKGETPLLAVTAPWEAMPGVYGFVGALLQKKFDLERIQKDRVKVAEILRAAGAQ